MEENMEGGKTFFDTVKKTAFLAFLFAIFFTILGSWIIIIRSVVELSGEVVLAVLGTFSVLPLFIIGLYVGRSILKNIKLLFRKNDTENDLAVNKNFVLCNTIKPRKMFYNKKESEAIQKLICLLSEENYRKILERLDKKDMRKGFTCLFTGEPGTGKTETAYQIARQTGRGIMAVDITETKSMWFGESEEKIKEIFDTYRDAVNNSEIAPILLFNEADGVIGKRLKLNSSSRAVDQAQNGVQNIILQEMENLSGILIATTNLAQNMDSAFERRFLYKITFDKPDALGRNCIWNALSPELPEELVAELSGRFELSGGQIENIARKIDVDAILTGCVPRHMLIQYCQDESHSVFNASKRIGFEII
jgi:hypothetical protein